MLAYGHTIFSSLHLESVGLSWKKQYMQSLDILDGTNYFLKTPLPAIMGNELKMTSEWMMTIILTADFDQLLYITTSYLNEKDIVRFIFLFLKLCFNWNYYKPQPSGFQRCNQDSLLQWKLYLKC